MDKSELLVIGGPNGSGQSTLAKEYLSKLPHRYLCADDIAFELKPSEPDKASIPAAREFSSRLKKALDHQESLVIESTLSGLSLQRWLAIAKDKNYQIAVAFVFLDSADLCLERVTERVARGGHNVPEQDVRRRFPRAIHNFWHIYRHAADEWSLFHNSGETFRQIAFGVKDEFGIIDEAVFCRWKGIVET